MAGSEGASKPVRLAQTESEREAFGKEPAQSRLLGNLTFDVTPDEEFALRGAEGGAITAIAKVRRLEPDWQPSPGAYNDVQGAIAYGNAVQAEAEGRLQFQESLRMGDNGPPSSNDPASNSLEPDVSLDSYRSMTGMPDLGGLPARAKGDGTVAKADIGGAVVFGVNSDAPGYTMFDRVSANAMRDQLIRKNPEVMSTTNLGWMPNNAVYHAEATSLMRWARKLGTSLKGKNIEITIDRDLCTSCDMVLPYIGLELGDPDVTVIEPSGFHRTMRGGRWQE